MFLEAVKAGGIVHRGTDELDREVSWAAFRKIGNAGGFDAQAPMADSSALDAKQIRPLGSKDKT